MDLDGMIQMTTRVNDVYGLKPFDKDYMFYFDETNNIRKFLLTPSKVPRVNEPRGLHADFILGGVCFKNAPCCDDLFDFYKSKHIVKELKSRHLFKHNQDSFQYDFSGERVTALFDWFEKNQDVYLHYAIVNNLYFALVDIVDSLPDTWLHMYKFHFELKDALYRVCKLYQEDILELLCRYEYPNISRENLRNFAQKISDIIDDADIRDDFYAEALRQMLKTVNKITEMPFIVDNKSFVLQDGYSAIYTERMTTFRESILVFDKEPEVLKSFIKTSFLSELPNCSFVDSAMEKFIQISDCIIACLSKTYQFLDSFYIEEIASMKVEVALKNNLRRLKSLINRSDNKNRLLIMNLNARSLTQERYEKLAIICDK
ncbi:MAG: hypothetical protein FWH01_07775 [Oscillospiraceae bacterium]|nr:hypothetical protein [Oscillospiraceae bacterium]